jgi:hypothetical protein
MLALECLVDVQFGWVYQNYNIINLKEDNQVVVGKEAWCVQNLFQAKILECFGQVLIPEYWCFIQPIQGSAKEKK